MYDDRTYENIMDEMMDEFGENVSTGEGSLAYNACAKIAEKLEDVYGEMDMIGQNMSPDTMDLEHLITYGQTQRGIEYSYATSPIVKAVFKQGIEIGQQFLCGDYTYTVIEEVEGYTYKLMCDTEGTEANATRGDLEPLDYVDEYQGGSITELMTPGTNDEEKEAFRDRVIASFKSAAFCGNKADYRKEIDAMSGIGGCKPKRREKGSAWIAITVIGSDYDVPAQRVIAAVQTAIDPEQSHGEGDGLAPICHSVKIEPVTAAQVDVSTSITWDAGYTEETCKDQINEAVQSYLLKLRQEWEKNELNDMYVRVSQIDARMLAVEGVADVQNTSINGSEENLILTYEKIPTFGGVTIV